MIITEVMCVCNGCGFREKIASDNAPRGNTYYSPPPGWLRLDYNPYTHFCPSCAKRLDVKYGGEYNAH